MKARYDLQENYILTNILYQHTIYMYNIYIHVYVYFKVSTYRGMEEVRRKNSERAIQNS